MLIQRLGNWIGAYETSHFLAEKEKYWPFKIFKWRYRAKLLRSY